MFKNLKPTNGLMLSLAVGVIAAISVACCAAMIGVAVTVAGIGALVGWSMLRSPGQRLPLTREALSPVAPGGRTGPTAVAQPDETTQMLEALERLQTGLVHVEDQALQLIQVIAVLKPSGDAAAHVEQAAPVGVRLVMTPRRNPQGATDVDGPASSAVSLTKPASSGVPRLTVVR